jgi:ABC-type transport system involved in cytochrome c biogenesis ATPase subunit
LSAGYSIYRVWLAQATFWLDDEPTIMTAMTAGFSRMTATAVNEKAPGARRVLKTALNMRVVTVQVHICTAE